MTLPAKCDLCGDMGRYRNPIIKPQRVGGAIRETVSVEWQLLCERHAKEAQRDGSNRAVDPATLFTERRKDGWPLCPQCGEEELGSRFMPQPPDYPVGTIDQYIEAGMWCHYCGWRLNAKPRQKGPTDAA